ncbi:MAG: glycine cleavage system aminomethyltransferase GcvT [Rhodospirillaceae bacterium]|nr:glycine cleavage system aminomethyltransferase GcvT [Rhodospirillaceae bacterium]
MQAESFRRTPLFALHRELGAKMVPFAGYEMPVQYPAGILAEHLHTRGFAGLFDVSHMGQALLVGSGAAAALETLVPGEIQGLAVGAMRYTLFTTPTGGILDDFMVTNAGDHLFVVVNAACKTQDFAHLNKFLRGRCEIVELADKALLALQGPAAAAIMARLAPDSAELRFLTGAAMAVGGISCFVTRSGYTGEDGFEISLPAEAAEKLARRLLAEPEVKPVGLGARDSLRLEAGLCLYGHDINATTTPVEAGLAWTIGKRRRVEGGFAGSEIILRQLTAGVSRRRIGIAPEGRAPARENTPITDRGGRRIGTVTSGGYGPTVEAPLAMGYVETESAAVGTAVQLVVRDVPRPAQVVALPFVKPHYVKG